jgi:hypothetical protein
MALLSAFKVKIELGPTLQTIPDLLRQTLEEVQVTIARSHSGPHLHNYFEYMFALAG